jgi:predicted nucleic acid-binding protein
VITVVSNSSPIIGLSKINKLNLLWELFDEVYITSEVFKEISHGSVNAENLKSIEILKKAVDKNNIKVYEVEDKKLVAKLYGKFHKGELETIIAAKELKADFVVIDEKAARRLAESFLLTTIGIVGVLIYAKTKGKILKLKPLLDELIRIEFRISDKIYKMALEHAGELDN